MCEAQLLLHKDHITSCRLVQQEIRVYASEGLAAKSDALSNFFDNALMLRILGEKFSS